MKYRTTYLIFESLPFMKHPRVFVYIYLHVKIGALYINCVTVPKHFNYIFVNQILAVTDFILYSLC